jgi:hypothetical protein
MVSISSIVNYIIYKTKKLWNQFPVVKIKKAVAVIPVPDE